MKDWQDLWSESGRVQVGPADDIGQNVEVMTMTEISISGACVQSQPITTNIRVAVLTVVFARCVW